MKSVSITFLTLVTLIFSGASTTHAAIRTVSNSSELQSALNAAAPGDEIVLKDGIYAGQFKISSNSGTASFPITVRAENRHKAILENTHSCADSASAQGLTIARSYWIIRDLRIRKQQRAVMIQAANVTFQHNIVEDFDEEGVRIQGVSGVTIESNVVGYGTACVKNRDGAGIVLVTNADKNKIINNIVVATGDNGYQAGNKEGYGIMVANNSDSNVVQGNLLLGNGGKGVLRILAGSTQISANNNIVRDNAALWGEGGFTSSDCVEDSNSFINNLIYGLYYSLSGTKGNFDGTKGHHLWQNNTVVMTPFTRIGHASGGGGCGGLKTGLILKDNVILSEYAVGNTNHALVYVDSMNEYNTSETGYNLIWSPGSTTNRFRNYSPAKSDIQSRPVFVDATNGDFSLASGSPGKNASSTGSDVGIVYNSYLKKQWLANAFRLETQQRDNLSTSISFTVSPNHFYQVWFFIPTSACSLTNETFHIEGTNLSRNIAELNNGVWIHGAEQRWITLGRHRATDGTLNISWTTNSCAEKIFIRKLPTTDEAFAWITGATTPAPPPPPPSLAIPAAPGNLAIQTP